MFVAQSRAVVNIEVKMLVVLVITAVGGQPTTAMFRDHLLAKVGGDGQHLLNNR